MSEIKHLPLLGEEQIQNLKNEMVVLSLNPDAVQDYAAEDERSTHIDTIKLRLAENGVDADQVLKDAIAENLKLRIKAPLAEVIQIDSSKRAS